MNTEYRYISGDREYYFENGGIVMKKVFSLFLSCVFTAALGAGEFAVTAAASEETPVSNSGLLDSFISDIINGDGENADIDGLEMSYDDINWLTSSVPKTPNVLINNNSGAYRYGDFLTGTNKKVYDKFSDLIAPTAYSDGEIGTFTFALDTTVSVEINDKSDISTDEENELWDKLWAECKPGMDSAFLDIPELFWIDPGQISLGIKGAGISQNNIFKQSQGHKKYSLNVDRVTLTFDCYDVFGSLQSDTNAALESINYYREQLEQAVDSFLPKSGNRYEKIKQIHDAISYYTEYDNSLSYEFMSSPIGALVAPPVVCEGYSEGFKLLCDRLDIPCVCVFGNYDEDANAGHMWNYVQMEDGKWYSVDVTWDDQDGSNGKEVYYQYFLKGSNNNKGHYPDNDYGITYLAYPELSEDDFDPDSYYVTTTETETTTTTTTTTSTTTTTEETTTTTTTTSTTTSETTTTTTTTTSTTTTTEETTTTTSTTTSETTTTTTETTTTTTESETTTESTTTEPETTTTELTTTESETTTTELTTTESETTTTESTTTEPETTEPVYDEGDVNHDGEVSIADVISCVRVVLGRGAYNDSCDVTGDGIVNVFDVILIKRIVFMAR